MISKSMLDLLRSVLSKSLRKIDDWENESPRAKKRPWYSKEYHFHSVIVALISAVILYLVFISGLEPSFESLLSVGVFVFLLIAIFSIYMRRELPDLARNEEAMSLLAVVFLSTIVLGKAMVVLSAHVWWLSIYSAPILAAALIIALLFPARLGMVIAFLVATVFGMLNNYSLEPVLVGATGGLAIIAFGTKARTSRQVLQAGFFAGLLQMAMLFFLSVIRGWETKGLWLPLLSALVGGQLSALLTLACLPSLETFFSRVSNLRLLELSDRNHPLLKRMSLEATGTFHHSLIVATLAEDASNEIGANGLLARVGAYYHDIGKLVKSEYFIENQSDHENPHDEVSPSLSRLIITSHVKDGVALGLEYKLDQAVLDFIPQHHGTSKIEFFYHKAVKQEEHEEEDMKEDIEEESYRYPGPKPQSKEAGVIMLADSVEAAARSLEEPTHQRYKDIIQKVIETKLSDGQLDETPLTLKNLHQISERFLVTLLSVHHQRVPYPDDMSPSNSDEKINLFP